MCGLPGSGKSFLGLMLADVLGFPFYDLDYLIVANEEKSIDEIFKTHGENYFREKEKEALNHFFDFHETNDYVLALGGGTPCFFDNLLRIKERGILIWLDTDEKKCAERIAQRTLGRPMFSKLNADEIEKKLKFLKTERLKFYSKADQIVNSEKKSLIDTVKEMLNYS